MRDDIEFNIKFCELVENHPELYDYNQSSYSNRSVQDKAWELIAQELNESVSGWGYRHQQCLILFFSLTIAYSIRACMSVSLVAMVESEEDYQKVVNSSLLDENATGLVSNMTSDKPEFQFNGILNRLMLVPPYPKFKWSKKIQDSILASFFWGYMLLQIPASELAHRFGSRYLLFGSLVINSVVSIAIPWASFYGGWILTIIFRIIQGLAQACIMPGMHSFFGKWANIEERSRLTGYAYGGQALGVVLGLPITGFIAASPLGWPGVFRFYGLLSAIIAVVLWFTVADCPAKHPKISDAERRYIEVGLGQKNKQSKKHLPVPWGKILRTRAVYAIIIAHIGQSYGQVTLFAEIPAFMDKVMGVNIKANGLLSALPFLVMWVTNFFFSWFTDMLIVKKILSVTNARKVANTIGYVPAAIGLFLLAYVPKNLVVVEIILVVICAFKVSASSGFMVNHIDLSSNFAGTLMSLSNFVSNLCGSLSPIVAGYILTDIKSERQWGYVFIISSGIYSVCSVVYLIFGEAERVEWDDTEKKHEDNTDTAEAVPMLENGVKKKQLVH